MCMNMFRIKCGRVISLRRKCEDKIIIKCIYFIVLLKQRVFEFVCKYYFRKSILNAS